MLGGRRGAVDATLPPLAFGLGWQLSGQSVGWGVAVAVAVGVALAGWRLAGRARPTSVLLGLAAVCAAGIIALYTGRAQDFFMLQLLSNGASILVWTVSIMVRRPLLGVVVGLTLRQRGRWRQDPALLHAYGRASWVWVAQYVVRVAVFLPLWTLGWIGALTAARVALTWPLVAACLAVSWWVLRRSLPPGHPGPRHPLAEDAAGAETDTAAAGGADSGPSTTRPRG